MLQTIVYESFIMCIEYIAFRMVTQAHPYRGISMLMKRRGAPSTQIMRERVI